MAHAQSYCPRFNLFAILRASTVNVANNLPPFSLKSVSLLLVLILFSLVISAVDGSLAINTRGNRNSQSIILKRANALKDENTHNMELLVKLLTAQNRLFPVQTEMEKQDGTKRVKRNVNKREVTYDKKGEAQYYIEEIFWFYSNDSKMSLEDFDMLLAHIGLKMMTRFANETTHDHTRGDHDHDHDHHDHEHEGEGEGHHHDDHDDHHHDDHYGHHHDDHNGHHHDDHHGHHHHDHDHRRRRRETDDHDHDHNNNGTEEEEEQEYHISCLTSTELLDHHGLSGKSALEPEDFLFLCPALIYYLETGACREQHHHHEERTESEHIGGIVWLYAMLSVLVISLCALFGILCIPRRGGNENIVMQFLIALAMASMSGDGMLHLIPHAMVEHHGDEEDDHHQDDEGAGHLDSLYKGLLALMGIYAFFFLERGFAIIKTLRDAKNPKHHGVATPMMPVNGDTDGHDSHGHSHDSVFSCTSLAMMIIVGDMFHNFCDGLAIGAAFAGSLSVGLSTSIAVFCHELPHEIGDFAVLITSGMSAKRAIAFNLLSTVPCFLGAAIGLELGSLGDLSLWIFAFVGGLFLYISLVNLVPEMTRAYARPKAPWLSYLLVHLAGMTLGVIIMVLLGIYEDDLQTLLT